MSRGWRSKNIGLWEEVSIKPQDLTDVLYRWNIRMKLNMQRMLEQMEKALSDIRISEFCEKP